MEIKNKLIKKAATFSKESKKNKKDAYKSQYKTFKKLIHTAKDTEFGKQYLFDQILTAKYDLSLFQKLVPIFTYEKIYKEWWKRMKRGDRDTCWPGKIKYFALSSGTTNASSKCIPVSKQMIKSIRKTSMRQMFTMVKFDLPQNTFSNHVLMIGSSTALEEINGKHFGDMSGISAAHAIPKWFAKQYYKPGYEISNIAEWDKRIDAIVKNAPNWNVGVICGIPNWVYMVLDKIIEHYKVETIHDIWPNLNLYIHGGIVFEPYRTAFEKLFNREIGYAETYMASEGYFAYTASQKDEGMKLLLNNSIFYEFIPFNENNFDEEGNLLTLANPITINKVEEDVDYAIMITNNSGAWRYLLGDTIKFINAKKATIKITGRTKHYLSDCGEHLSWENMYAALQKALTHFEMEAREFTIITVQNKNRYHHKWFIAGKENTNCRQFALKLDAQLKLLNNDYKISRTANLGTPEVEFLSPKLFYNWMKKEGKMGDQHKIPAVMRGKMKESWIRYIHK